MPKPLSVLLWTAVAILGAAAFGVLALRRGETVNAAWLLTAALCTYAIAYRTPYLSDCMHPHAAHRRRLDRAVGDRHAADAARAPGADRPMAGADRAWAASAPRAGCGRPS